SLYLKTHYPLEFYTAVINNFGGFYRTELYVRQAMMHGARVHPPCIERSGMLCTIDGKDLYLGLILIGGLEQRTGERIVQERERNGSYGSMEALTARVPMKREQLELLIRVGALRSTGRSRKELLWEKHRCLEGSSSALSPKLLDTRPETLELPALDEAPYEEAFEEWEILGFPLCSPFELLRTEHRGDVMAWRLVEYEGQRVRIMGIFVSFKPVRTVRKERMGFGAWQDPEGTFFDTTHFPDELRQYPLRGEGCYLIQGKVDLDFGFPSIEVERMAKLPWIADPRTSGE
ncbi:MAG: DNA polymerase III subunit alpha, partial [Flavobacteriales bacterium]